MPARPVLIAPHDTLRQVCAPVTVFDGALGQLAVDMLASMYAAYGRGLAAPQIGVTQRLFVMDETWKTGTPDPQVFVNPDIIAASDMQATLEEGCLSLPDHPVSVTRPDWVDLRWQDLSGHTHQARLHSFAAALVQHERDHLDGILITDYEDAA